MSFVTDKIKEKMRRWPCLFSVEILQLSKNLAVNLVRKLAVDWVLFCC